MKNLKTHGNNVCNYAKSCAVCECCPHTLMVAHLHIRLKLYI